MHLQATELAVCRTEGVTCYWDTKMEGPKCFRKPLYFLLKWLVPNLPIQYRHFDVLTTHGSVAVISSIIHNSITIYYIACPGGYIHNVSALRTIVV